MEEQFDNHSEIVEMRRDLQQLKSIVETFFTLLNKKLIKELYKEMEKMRKGEYYTEEEFMERHHLKNS